MGIPLKIPKKRNEENKGIFKIFQGENPFGETSVLNGDGGALYIGVLEVMPYVIRGDAL